MLRTAVHLLLVLAAAGLSAQPVLEQQPAGMTGHLSAAVNQSLPSPTYAGLGYYSTVYKLESVPTLGTQLGWGSFVMPQNQSFTEPLCPVGTVARDFWPDRGPSYWQVYQTIEGGMGQWGSTRFPSSSPRYRINATPDCYSTQIASSAWTFNGELLPDDKLGLAQLSHRLLVPPDGISFVGADEPSLLGNAWIALPLIQSQTSLAGVPTGDQSWTLFLHTSNFKGPVAFYTPETWSRINAVDSTGVGRGHDFLPGFSDAVAMEIGTLPMFKAESSGTVYARVPRITFAADASGRAILVQDVRTYTKSAIWDAVADWIANGTVADGFTPEGSQVATLDWSNFIVRLDGSPITLASSFTAGIVQTDTGNPALGMQWTEPMENGVLPEYYVKQGDSWTPIAASQVPSETGLAAQTFKPAVRSSFPTAAISPGSGFEPALWSAGPFTRILSDGSVIHYVWYRFIDQPAIRRLGLSIEELDRLQNFVESFHEHSGIDGITIPPPSSGKLATIDPRQFVDPPPGLEKGHVPIVIGQENTLRRRTVRR